MRVYATHRCVCAGEGDDGNDLMMVAHTSVEAPPSSLSSSSLRGRRCSRGEVAVLWSMAGEHEIAAGGALAAAASREEWARLMRLRFSLPEMLTPDGAPCAEYARALPAAPIPLPGLTRYPLCACVRACALWCRYFRPREFQEAKKWSSIERERLLTGIERYGIGAWSTIRMRLLPDWVRACHGACDGWRSSRQSLRGLTRSRWLRQTENELRVKTARLLGRQSLKAYKHWRGNALDVQSEYQRNKEIGLAMGLWKGGLLIDNGKLGDKLMPQAGGREVRQPVDAPSSPSLSSSSSSEPCHSDSATAAPATTAATAAKQKKTKKSTAHARRAASLSTSSSSSSASKASSLSSSLGGDSTSGSGSDAKTSRKRKRSETERVGSDSTNSTTDEQRSAAASGARRAPTKPRVPSSSASSSSSSAFTSAPSSASNTVIRIKVKPALTSSPSASSSSSASSAAGTTAFPTGESIPAASVSAGAAADTPDKVRAEEQRQQEENDALLAALLAEESGTLVRALPRTTNRRSAVGSIDDDYDEDEEEDDDDADYDGKPGSRRNGRSRKRRRKHS